MKNIYYLILLIIVFGCNNSIQTNNTSNDTSTVKSNTQTNKSSYDTSAVKTNNGNNGIESHIKIDTTIISVFQKEYNTLINSKLKRWITFYKKNCTTFNINKFSLCKTDYLKPYYFDLPDGAKMQKFLELYSPYLIWNSDSSMAIDLYSTNVWLDFDSSGNKYAEFDVDSHVDLIDFKNKKGIVLMQTGTFSSFNDGFWIDNDNVLITETGKNLDNDIIDNTFIIKYFVINLNTYQTSRYCSNQSYKTNKSYLLEVFKGIKVNGRE